MTKRHYDDGCGTAHALELVGERWALLIVRELLLGPKRFTDLRESLPGISPNVLTQRLDELEQSSLLVRRKTAPPNSVAVYELTPWGMELETIVQSIGRWAARSPTKRPDGHMSVNSIIMSLRTMFSADAAEDFDATINLRVSGQDFAARIAGGAFKVERGQAATPDVSIDSDSNVLAELIYGGLSLSQGIKSASVKLTGDQKTFLRFAKLFPLPARAPDLNKANTA